MAQNKKQSVVEAVFNTVLGMLIGWSVSLFILMPLLDIPITPGKNTIITVIFTLISILRGIFVRRFFNYIHLKRKFGKRFDKTKIT